MISGLALAPFRVIGGGRLRSDADEELRRQTGEKGRTLWGPNWERNEKETKMSRALEKVANEVAQTQGRKDGEVSISAVCIAYVMQKTPFVFPIIGGRKVEHLQQNVEGLKIALSDEQIKEIEETLPFDPGFPNIMIVSGPFICQRSFY